ncbi:peptide chain release factor N(5)-glutamine methyltransferase [PVC group bacterium]|nr:peptide chain release factor N(5)-glutamine methyltransferase [PVC group bacterium]
MSELKTKLWTTRQLLDWMTDQFASKEIGSPRLIGEMLLTHVLGGERIDLYANANRVASDSERASLRALVKRAMQQEPVQYIVGSSWFFGTEFQVNQSTLIPRSCTERLVERTISFCKKLSQKSPRIADIGTGSGCIAVTLANNIKTAEIIATDISSDALKLARENARLQGVARQLKFLEGDGITPLLELDPFNVICTNPPYIPDCEMSKLAKHVVDWEPKLALSGGEDGMAVASGIIKNAAKILKPNGLLLMEIASSTRDLILEIAQSEPELKDAKILRDAFGDDRFLEAIRCYK